MKTFKHNQTQITWKQFPCWWVSLLHLQRSQQFMNLNGLFQNPMGKEGRSYNLKRWQCFSFRGWKCDFRSTTCSCWARGPEKQDGKWLGKTADSASWRCLSEQTSWRLRKQFTNKIYFTTEYWVAALDLLVWKRQTVLWQPSSSSELSGRFRIQSSSSENRQRVDKTAEFVEATFGWGSSRMCVQKRSSDSPDKARREVNAWSPNGMEMFSLLQLEEKFHFLHPLLTFHSSWLWASASNSGLKHSMGQWMFCTGQKHEFVLAFQHLAFQI